VSEDDTPALTLNEAPSSSSSAAWPNSHGNRCSKIRCPLNVSTRLPANERHAETTL
ncbi:hypothetical protein BgiBS90_004946, partial [Biomphalaria glabrata]